MKKISWIDIVGRVILFIPIVVIITYATIKWWLQLIYGFVVYGGETVVYNKKINRSTIADIFIELQKLREEE